MEEQKEKSTLSATRVPKQTLVFVLLLLTADALIAASLFSPTLLFNIILLDEKQDRNHAKWWVQNHCVSLQVL